MLEVDIEVLISLVQDRLILWDKTENSYKDRVKTKSAWVEVCKQLRDNFEEISEQERNEFDKVLNSALGRNLKPGVYLQNKRKMVVTRGQILKLYKNLMTEASKFPSYNFRMYALRRVRDKFSENKHVTDTKLVEEQYTAGLQSLEVIKRQVVIGNIFKSDQLIIEKIRNKSPTP